MEAFGAEVIVVDQAEGAVDGQVSGDDLALVEERAAQIVTDRHAFRVDQFRREANILLTRGIRGRSSGNNPRARSTSSSTWSGQAVRSPASRGHSAGSIPGFERTRLSRQTPRYWQEGR